ncbi:hypothetical protein BJ742DRAFT_768058 [Cladochytrium replicatum]|nr:hypothetical protein BJ742DRAFT_768058 [Cladochytrium replicatum]
MYYEALFNTSKHTQHSSFQLGDDSHYTAKNAFVTESSHAFSSGPSRSRPPVDPTSITRPAGAPSFSNGLTSRRETHMSGSGVASIFSGDTLNEPVRVGRRPRTISSDGAFGASPERPQTPDREVAAAGSRSPLAATASIVPQGEEPRRPTRRLNPNADGFRSHFSLGADDSNINAATTPHPSPPRLARTASSDIFNSSIMEPLRHVSFQSTPVTPPNLRSSVSFGNPESPLVRRPSTPNKNESTVVLGDDGGVALESTKKKKSFQRRMVTPPGGSGSVSFSDFIGATAPAVEASAEPTLKKVDPAKIDVVAGKSTGKHRVY